MRLVAGVSSLPGSAGVGQIGQPRHSEMSTVGMNDFDLARMNKLFHRFGCKPPHWKDVLYAARHDSSIVGFQMAQLAEAQADLPVMVEFEHRPGKWVDACDWKADDTRTQLAADIAVGTWAQFRSPSGSQPVAVKQTAEVYGSTGEGYGIEHVGRTGKPAVSVVHCPAVEVLKDGSIKWTRRKGGAPEIVPRSRYERLFREDETYVDDCTSPWRHIVADLICFEIVNAALKKAATSDMLLRGLVWAPASGPNEAASWIGGYMDIVEQALRNPEMLGGLMPYPVASGISAPEHVDFGESVTDGLIKLHDLYVHKIARASVWPAQLVLEGPGAGNAYADHALNRTFLQRTVAPPLTQYVYPDLAAWWWHPKLESNPQFRQTGIDACRFRLAPNIAAVANRPDSRKELLELNKRQPVKPAVLADAFGLPEDALCRPGDPEYAEWLELQLLLGNKEPNPSGPRSDPDLGGGVPDTEGFTLGEPVGPRMAELGALW